MAIPAMATRRKKTVVLAVFVMAFSLAKFNETVNILVRCEQFSINEGDHTKKGNRKKIVERVYMIGVGVCGVSWFAGSVFFKK